MEMREQTRNARFIPSTNSSAPTMRLVGSPENSPERLPAPATVAMIAPMTAKLVACPEQRIVARVPEAIPSLRLSTEPMTALVLGLEKKPTPIPIKSRPISTRQTGESTSNVDSQTSAMATVNMPEDASALEPNRSDSLPAIGEMRAMVTGMMSSTNPASRTDMPSTLCR